jgi:hypothetical protein
LLDQLSGARQNRLFISNHSHLYMLTILILVSPKNTYVNRRHPALAMAELTRSVMSHSTPWRWVGRNT